MHPCTLAKVASALEGLSIQSCLHSLHRIGYIKENEFLLAIATYQNKMGNMNNCKTLHNNALKPFSNLFIPSIIKDGRIKTSQRKKRKKNMKKKIEKEDVN